MRPATDPIATGGSSSSTVFDRVGVCTWIFGGVSLRDAMSRIALLGADGIELFGDLDVPVDAVRALLDEYDLELYSLTPANVDIAHPLDRERSEAVDYYLRLLDFAADLGYPLVSCHGFVSRHHPIASQAEERRLLVGSLRTICRHATGHGVKPAFEVLNRYETHLVNTADQAMELADQVGSDDLGVLLDTYHMNIEESDPVGALHRVGRRLALYHVADSNREAIGRGHIDFEAQFEALRVLEYRGPVIIECTAPGPNPFTPDKGPGYLDVLAAHVAASVERLRRAGNSSAAPQASGSSDG